MKEEKAVMSGHTTMQDSVHSESMQMNTKKSIDSKGRKFEFNSIKSPVTLQNSPSAEVLQSSTQHR